MIFDKLCPVVLGGQLAHDIGGWSRLRVMESGAGPQCGTLRVAQLHCSRLDRSGHHSYLGILHTFRAH